MSAKHLACPVISSNQYYKHLTVLRNAIWPWWRPKTGRLATSYSSHFYLKNNELLIKRDFNCGQIQVALDQWLGIENIDQNSYLCNHTQDGFWLLTDSGTYEVSLQVPEMTVYSLTSFSETFQYMDIWNDCLGAVLTRDGQPGLFVRTENSTKIITIDDFDEKCIDVAFSGAALISAIDGRAMANYVWVMWIVDANRQLYEIDWLYDQEKDLWSWIIVDRNLLDKPVITITGGIQGACYALDAEGNVWRIPFHAKNAADVNHLFDRALYLRNACWNGLTPNADRPPTVTNMFCTHKNGQKTYYSYWYEHEFALREDGTLVTFQWDYDKDQLNIKNLLQHEQTILDFNSHCDRVTMNYWHKNIQPYQISRLHRGLLSI